MGNHSSSHPLDQVIVSDNNHLLNVEGLKKYWSQEIEVCPIVINTQSPYYPFRALLLRVQQEPNLIFLMTAVIDPQMTAEPTISISRNRETVLFKVHTEKPFKTADLFQRLSQRDPKTKRFVVGHILSIGGRAR